MKNVSQVAAKWRRLVRLRVEGGPHSGFSRAELLRRAKAMHAALDLQDAELSIVLTGDRQIRKLNARYRGQDKHTDVLAFPMREGLLSEMAGELLGDVVISVPRARAQAQERGVPLLAELTMLMAHGVLHLLGWDHATRDEDRRMRKETDRLCAVAAKKPGKRPRTTHRGRVSSSHKRARG